MDHEVTADDGLAVERLRVAEVAVAVVVHVHLLELQILVVQPERLEDRHERRAQGAIGRGRVIGLHRVDLGHLADDVHRQPVGRVHQHRRVGERGQCVLHVRGVILGLSRSSGSTSLTAGDREREDCGER